MIKFHENNDNEIFYKNIMLASHLAVNDHFVKAVFHRINGCLNSLTPYTVKKILKRDVVCESDSGKELRFSINSVVYDCFLPDSEDLNNLLKEDEHRKRRLKCLLFLEKHTFNRHIDDEFMDAIEAYEERVNAKKESHEDAT